MTKLPSIKRSNLRVKNAPLAFGLALSLAVCAQAADSLPRSILFVDDADVLMRPGTIKQVVVFEKYEDNPVIPPTKPWEGMIGWSSVYRDPNTGKYQAWYQAYQQARSEDKSLRCVIAYAESDDGLHWVKPDLGLFPFYEIKQTNIVLVGAGNEAYGDRYGCSVLVDEHDPDPAKRYKLLHYDWEVGEKANLGAGIRVAYSPDGIHWTQLEGMVSKTAFGGKWEQPPFADEDIYVEEHFKGGKVRKSWRVPMSMSDALDVIYDERLGVYVCYGKMWYSGPDGGLAWKHGMGRMESVDFIHWSRPELVLTTNDRDPAHLEFHTSPVFIYDGLYLSLNQVLDRGAGIIDAEFMSSRDGLHWDRTFANIPVIPRGTSGEFDAGSILTNGTPIVLDDEIRFYYGAYRGPATGGVDLDKQVSGSKDYFSGIGLATTPRDRFVAVTVNPETPVKGQKKNAPRLGNTIGAVTLRAQDLSGVKSLSLNVNAIGGEARVEILTEDGYRMRGFTKDDAVPVAVDGLDLVVSWRDKSLSDLPPGRYLIRVYLERAKLYAVTLN